MHSEDMFTGLLRSCRLLAISLPVPAVWAAGVAVAGWWHNPWTWFAPAVWVCLGTLLLLRPVTRWARSLVADWTGTALTPGYRDGAQVVQLSTGFWWNGHSYEKTRRDAEKDLRMRLRWTDPANWRDLRFVALLSLVWAVPAIAIVAFIQSAPVLGVVCLILTLAGMPFAWRLLPAIALRFLSRSAASRVEELTAQRAEATVAQASEIRRIERDLHDGAQARLVALGLSLATAEKLMERDPAQAKALLQEARVGAAASLSELRELVRGINPPVLNERGLVDAVRALAMDTPLSISVHAPDGLTLDPPVESALYFAVAELLTNAVKHAAATEATVVLTRDDTGMVVVVEDNGRGGAAVAAGGGLAGLQRRLAAFDGTLNVTSPAGGPTRARMTVPCESL